MATEEFERLLKPLHEMMEKHQVEFTQTKEKSTQWEINLVDLTFMVPQGIKFTLDSLDPMIFSETFVYDIHFTGFDLQDKVVIDAGGFVGDTALYYAKMGAIVYTFEPDPNNYEKLIRNLELNKELSNNIHPINAAIGVDGTLDFPIGGGGGGSMFTKNFATFQVKSMSIEQILKTFDITDPFLLHLDIKGAEDLILEDPELENFERLRMEYSPYLNEKSPKTDDYPAWLTKRLKDIGFEKVRIFKHNDFRKPLSVHGTVDASRS